MKRRNFLQVLSAGAALPFMPSITLSQNSTANIIKPKALLSGDTVGVIAPGTAVSDPDSIAKAKEVVEYYGLQMQLGEYVLNGAGYKSRTIEQRLSDLKNMFENPNIKAIFCIRGGYGSAQLLDKIDYDLIKENPKIFLGYSDITAMHLAINRFAGLITFHGPVMLSKFSPYTANHLKKALFQTEAIGEVTNPDTISGIRKAFPLRTVVSGTAKGKLIGGNLTIISTTLGTPFEIDTKDKILFLEDVGEEPYSIDRMLTQLRLSGKLQEAAGIIFGKCAHCNAGSSSNIWDNSLGELLDNHLKPLNIPVLYGLMIGHTADQLTLPIGIEAELDTDNGVLNILEAAVV